MVVISLFEPDLQRLFVDIRYVLFMIDKWGKCPARLIEGLKLVR